jgi:ethanolamine-phosphate cytidylyltransferase
MTSAGKNEGSGEENPQTTQREIRLFMDGAFDLMHFGHMNAFRLGRALGTHLVVGLNSDASITECKGAPFMNEQERLAMVSACKFVDEVVPDVPYIMNQEYLEYVVEKYRIDYVIHGDDPCIVDGKDVYATAKAAGKYRSIPRTEGVSTTDIIGRMLLMTKDLDHNNSAFLGQQSKFLTTGRMLRLFSHNIEAPKAHARVVYIDGAWDVLHPGHVSMLKQARERGDYLIVGVHSDAIVNQTSGMNLPLMNLQERVLSVLGCRYVDDVLISAPYEMNDDMIDSLNISEVVYFPDDNTNTSDESRFRAAQNRDILYQMENTCDFTIDSIIQRIRHNQDTVQARFERKVQAEQTFYKEKRQAKGGS